MQKRTSEEDIHTLKKYNTKNRIKNQGNNTTERERKRKRGNKNNTNSKPCSGPRHTISNADYLYRALYPRN